MSEFSQEKLKDIIETGGVGYKQNSRSYIFTCPRCNKQNKLYIRKSDGRFCCFRCAETDRFRGRPEYALAELFGWPLSEVRRRLYGDDYETKSVDDLLNFQLYDFWGEDDEVTEDVTASIPTALYPMDFYPIDDPKSVRGRDYLEQERGVSIALAKRYGLRYCPPTRRVIFPVEVHGRLLGWQARSVIKTEFYDESGELHTIPKILGNTDLKRELTVMFGDRLKYSEHAVVCEGPLDAIKADLCGGNIATMGKSISAAQIEIILNSGVSKVYLALDPDAASDMERLCQAFGDLKLYHLLPPRGCKDLGEASPEAVLKAFQNAPRISNATCFVYLKY